MARAVELERIPSNHPMRYVERNGRVADDWCDWVRSKKSSRRSLLWCLVVILVAQFLVYRSLSNGHRPKGKQLTGRVALGRVVITGGGGNIGGYIARHLLASSTPVTIIDHIFYPDEFGLSDVASNPLLTVHIGDIRNTTLLSSAFTLDVVGVVHLASISRVIQCEENPRDCADVNQRGTQLVLDSLEHVNRQDQGKRWFVLSSSTEIYGDTATSTLREDAPTNPSTLYGTSKLAAETTVATRIRNMGSSSAVGTLHAVSLRLSHVYGGLYDHNDRLVPSIATQALWNLVIQVSGGQQTLDLLHIEDCVEAFLLAIQHLTDVSSTRTHVRRGGTTHSTFKVFNVASGHTISVSRLVDNVVNIAQSKSPIRNIPPRFRFSHISVMDVQKAWRQLGFQASIDVEKGLDMTLRTYLQHFEGYFSRRIATSCGTPSPTRSLNAQLQKLDGCVARIHMDDLGRLVSLSGPLSKDKPYWRVDDEILGTVVDIKASPRINAEGKPTFQIRDHQYALYLGVKNPLNGSVSIGPITESDLLSDPSIHADWEIETDADASIVKLILAGTKFQLAGPAPRERALHLIPSTQSRSWPFRITPMCCPAPGPWPFSADDPVDFSLEYQRESTERPFLASPRKALCNRLEAARQRAKDKLATLSSSSRQKAQRHTSDFAANWSPAKLPPCSNLCEETIICIDTGGCQCIESSCVRRQRFPFSASTHGNGISYPHRTLGNESLAEAVEKTSWRDLIRPSSLRFIDATVPYPRIRVAPLSPTNQAIMASLGDVGRLRPQHCFSADAQLERAVARMNVKDDDAEMTFVPLYWAQFPNSENYFEQYDYLKEHLQGFDPGRVVIPFMQDWGQCMTFEWNVWLLREKYGLAHPPMVRNTTAWSVMGDLNSICYRPHQDVIIPPRTCLSAELVNSFSNVSFVRPSRDRRVFATFAGSLWGTGSHTRQRVLCPRYGWAHTPEHRLHPAGPPLSVVWGGNGGYNYMGILNDTVFCPQPAGTTGWSTRLIDAFYAGCIPVFFGHTKHFPFSDILDWSKLSVTIESHEISHMEDVLLSRYPLEDIEQLQRNILAVRNALMYPLDDIDTDTVQRQILDDRGPLFFALQSTRMKLMTKWPV